MKLLTSNSTKYSRELAGDYEDLTDMKIPVKQIAVAVNMPIDEVEKIQKDYVSIG